MNDLWLRCSLKILYLNHMSTFSQLTRAQHSFLVSAFQKGLHFFEMDTKRVTGMLVGPHDVTCINSETTCILFVLNLLNHRIKAPEGILKLEIDTGMVSILAKFLRYWFLYILLMVKNLQEKFANDAKEDNT